MNISAISIYGISSTTYGPINSSFSAIFFLSTWHLVKKYHQSFKTTGAQDDLLAINLSKHSREQEYFYVAPGTVQKDH